MIRAYDEYGNIVDLIEWEKKIRATAIDDFVSQIKEYYFTVEDSQFRPYLRGVNLISEPNINKIAEQLKEKEGE